MISAWTKHLKNTDEKDRFANELLGSKRVLQRLAELLDELKQEIEATEISPGSYDSPNWDYRQAHLNGEKSILNKVKLIIDLDHKENDRQQSTRRSGQR